MQDDGGTANGGVDLDPSANTITVDVHVGQRRAGGRGQHRDDRRGQAYTFVAADFGFSDTNDAPANAFVAVKITTLPASGHARSSTASPSRPASRSAADITAGNLKFAPAANENGCRYTTFTFQVQDNGGTANGGDDLDQSPNTITVDVTLGQRRAGRRGQDGDDARGHGVHVRRRATSASRDANDSPANALPAVKITTLPTAGTLKLDGVAVTAGQFVTKADIDAGKLTFAPAANANGVGVRDASRSRSRTTAAPPTAASTSISRRTR